MTLEGPVQLYFVPLFEEFIFQNLAASLGVHFKVNLQPWKVHLAHCLVAAHTMTPSPPCCCLTRNYAGTSRVTLKRSVHKLFIKISLPISQHLACESYKVGVMFQDFLP